VTHCVVTTSISRKESEPVDPAEIFVEGVWLCLLICREILVAYLLICKPSHINACPYVQSDANNLNNSGTIRPSSVAFHAPRVQPKECYDRLYQMCW